MLTTLQLFVLASASLAPPGAPSAAVAIEVTQDDEPSAPSKEEVAAAVKTLKAGLASKEPSERNAALLAASSVVHADVVKVVASALGDEVPAVRDFTLDLLSKIEDPSALTALHAFAKRNRRTLPDQPELYALVLKCVARHGDPSSIELLKDKPFECDEHAVLRARILGLANIRDKRAVEALFDLMTKADRRKVTPYMGELQLAFNVLLGVDVGKNQDRWRDWWNDNKKTYVLPEVMPKLPNDALVTWQSFWGIQTYEVRKRKRGDRGKDPEGG